MLVDAPTRLQTRRLHVEQQEVVKQRQALHPVIVRAELQHQLRAQSLMQLLPGRWDRLEVRALLHERAHLLHAIGKKILIGAAKG